MAALSEILAAVRDNFPPADSCNAWIVTYSLPATEI